ncbi:MAG: hypothetical protein OXI05_08690 [Bacteroidota bacterium]|nr:hypothetical protein [Bacteroidota bacterium]MXW15452.1 hypothetical protein [Rhodothermaceae bacterium]MDE2645901.1 hypothetical protein [Bacteroidota bacterium]MXW31948.1 hypothetical protein [Rhodothermaceae bacterium]MYC05215.1 hypothetical protein [Rhodothermaceae bacterium]
MTPITDAIAIASRSGAGERHPRRARFKSASCTPMVTTPHSTKWWRSGGTAKSNADLYTTRPNLEVLCDHRWEHQYAAEEKGSDRQEVALQLVDQSTRQPQVRVDGHHDGQRIGPEAFLSRRSENGHYGILVVCWPNTM